MDHNDGLLGEQYHHQRLAKKSLSYRLKKRAEQVNQALIRHGFCERGGSGDNTTGPGVSPDQGLTKSHGLGGATGPGVPPDQGLTKGHGLGCDHGAGRAADSALSKAFILDAGAADCMGTYLIAQAFPKSLIIGLEKSLELIKYCEKLPDKAKNNILPMGGDINHLPFLDETISAIVLCAVIEHFEKPVKALEEMARILKKDGLIAITSPHPFWEKIAVKLGLLEDEQHHKVPNKKDLKLWLEKSGFQVLEYRPFMLPASGLPKEASIEAFLRKIGLDSLFINQLIIGKKC